MAASPEGKRTEKSLSTVLTAEQRGQFRFVLYLLGVWEVLVGAAFAVLAPRYLGHDPEAYRLWAASWRR